VPGDLPEDVNGNAGIGHPGKPGVPQIMTVKMLIAESCTTSSQCVASRRTAVVMRPPRGPVNRRASGLSPTMSRRRATRSRTSGDQRDDASALPLRSLVHGAAGAGGRLPADRPDPGITVDITGPHAGDLTNAGNRTGREDDDFAPARIFVGGSLDEGGGKPRQGLPVGQSQRARIVELVKVTITGSGDAPGGRFKRCWLLQRPGSR
jgi:hypothetical protein